MSEPARPSTWQPASEDEVAWLLDVDEIGCTGFDPAGWPDTAWLLNAMYELPDMPTGLTHDDTYWLEVAAGTAQPLIVNGVDLTEATVVGGGVGWNTRPGPRYRRVRWQQLAARTGQPVVSPGRFPASDTCCGGPGLSGSWPAHLRVPTEGSLDVESWLRLTELLASHSDDGAHTECIAYFTPWTNADEATPFLLRGRLGDAPDLVGRADRVGSPQSFWPVARSWFVFTDWDLWASRISGPSQLINDLVTEDIIEAVRLPDNPPPKLHGAIDR